MKVKFIQNGKVVFNRSKLIVSGIDLFERFLPDFHYYISKVTVTPKNLNLYFYDDFNISKAIDEFFMRCVGSECVSVDGSKFDLTRRVEPLYDPEEDLPF